MDRHAALVFGAELAGDFGRAVRLAGAGHGGEVAYSASVAIWKRVPKKFRASESITISRTASTSAVVIREVSAWFHSSRPYS
jgi:hypothetical protein